MCCRILDDAPRIHPALWVRRETHFRYTPDVRFCLHDCTLLLSHWLNSFLLLNCVSFFVSCSAVLLVHVISLSGNGTGFLMRYFFSEVSRGMYLFCYAMKILNYFSYDFTGVTILLSLTVFLNMVAETMPATSDAVPLLGMAVHNRLLESEVSWAWVNRRQTKFIFTIYLFESWWHWPRA